MYCRQGRKGSFTIGSQRDSNEPAQETNIADRLGTEPSAAQDMAPQRHQHPRTKTTWVQKHGTPGSPAPTPPHLVEHIAGSLDPGSTRIPAYVVGPGSNCTNETYWNIILSLREILYFTTLMKIGAGVTGARVAGAGVVRADAYCRCV